jgi:hypothetical protein
MLRLVDVLKAEHPREVSRFVQNIPSWLTEESFPHACARTSIRDANEYVRRFFRLRRILQHGVSDDGAIATPQGTDRVERAVVAARIAFGAALEVVASTTGSRVCDPSQLPANPQEASRLARLCHDAYMTALWTDAHANYLLDVLADGSAVDTCPNDPHVHVGSPCIQRTVSVSVLPNIASKFERYCAGEQTIDAESNVLLSVLFRCGQSGSRGWDSALRASLAAAGPQWVLHTAFKACLIGMHPQLHPAARPDWTQRALILRLIEDELKPSSLSNVMFACGACTKESIRLYMCSVLNEIPATRTALARMQNSIGLLRSAPCDLVPASLAAAAQNIVNAGIDVGAALSKLQPFDESATGGGTSGASTRTSTSTNTSMSDATKCDAVKAIIQNRIGNEPRVRSRCGAQARASKAGRDEQTLYRAAAVVLHSQEQLSSEAGGSGSGGSATFYKVAYNPSWFGRVAADDDAEPGAGVPNNSLNALTVIHELSSRAFRAEFVPFWLHGHGNSVRTSRFDESQYNHMLKTSAVRSVLENVEETVALKVVRLAMRTPTAATSTISQVGRLLQFGAEDQRRLDESKTFEEAIASVCALSADAGSRLLLFGRIAALKNRFLSFSLGTRICQRQLRALARRFEVDDANDGDDRSSVVDHLPDHAYHIYMCLECKRVPNACVDDKTKMVSHNEVGLAQTMLRVGGVEEASEIRCARRSSAALRTALQKEDEAFRNRTECVEVTSDAMQHAMRDNGDVSHAARLRRDLRTCSEQHVRALACGDRPLVKISLLGSVVRVNNRFYAICSLCGCILQVSHLRRYGGDLCCCRCDASMICSNVSVASQATRVTVSVNTRTTRAAPYAASFVVPGNELTCRFCNKSPPTSSTASRFKVLRAPFDDGGRNAFLPPPLRTIALCQSHYRPWVENALQTMSMPVVLAHILEKAAPVYGADGESRETLSLTYKRTLGPRSATQKTIMKRVRGISALGRKR